MPLEKAGVQLVAEDQAAFESALESGNDAIADFGRQADNSSGLLSGFGEIAIGALRRVGEIAVDALFQAGAAVVGFAQDSFEAALDAEQAMTRIEQVIQSTGGAAGLTAEQAAELGLQFQTLAGGTDDTVLAIEEMALRMGNITAEQMPAFIQTALDLAAATGTDAVSGARLLALAQEDPISALRRFRRMGILVTEAEEEQIKTMVKAGDTAGAFAVVMERVGTATGGAALANSQTIAGQFEILKNTLGEAGEAALTGLLPVLHELTETVLPVLIPFMTDLGNAVGAAFMALGEGDLGGFFDALAEFESVQAILSNLGVSADQFRALGGAVEEFAAQAQAGFTTFIASIQPLIDSVMNLAAAFAEDFPLMLAVAEDTFDAIAETVGAFFPVIVDNVSDSLDTIAEFWREHGDTILALISAALQAIAFVTTATFTVISGFISVTLNAISGIIDTALLLIEGDWQGAHDSLLMTAAEIWFTIQVTIESIFNSVLAFLGTNLETLRADWQGAWDNMVLILGTDWERIKQGVMDGIEAVQLTLSRGILDAIDSLTGLLDLFTALGEGIVNSIAYGIRETIDYLEDVMLAGIRNTIRAAENLLDIGSPSRVFMEIGENIARGLAAGIMAGADTVADAIDQLFQAGGVIGGLGSAAANRLESRIVDPMRDQLGALDERISELSSDLGLAEGATPRSLLDMLRVTAAIGFGLSPEQREQLRAAEELVALEEQRLGLARDLTEQEERLAELQRQQEDLSFLQQQVKLLDLIQEYGLDAQSVLGDLALGVNADLPSIIDATARALQEIIAQTSVRLGFSPAEPISAVGAPVANTANFNLNMSTAQSSGSVISDFAILRALAGT